MSNRKFQITYYKFINALNIPRLIENFWPIVIAITLLIIGFVVFFTTITPNNSIGYTPDGPVYTTPGFHLKNPFAPPTYLKSTYHSIDFDIPTQTSDGHQLIYTLSLAEYKWEPTTFHTLYNHNERLYIAQQINTLKPYLDRYMSTKSGRDVYYNGESIVNELRHYLINYVNFTGLTCKPSRTHEPNFMYQGYFSGGIGLNELDDLYTCEQLNGLCNAFDAALGNTPTTTKSSQEATQVQILHDQVANNPNYQFEPSTDPIIMQPETDNLPSSDSDVRTKMCELYPETC